jgi:membrane protease YdiL (CAAX protease family)
MTDSRVAEVPEKPALRRIAEFPLMAMVLAILLYAFATALGIVIGSKLPVADEQMRFILKSAISLVIVLATYKLAIVRLGEHPRDDLPRKYALKYFSLGLLAGFLIFSLVVGFAAAFGVYRIVGYGSTVELAKDLIGDALLPGFMEEIFFRGILFRWVEEFAGSWAALALTSALFGLAHIFNPGATWFSSFAIAIEAGVLLGGVYMVTRSLWLPIGLHAAWNLTQGFLFDIPVSGTAENGLVEAKLSGPAILSGGGFGLEASVFAVGVATAFGIWFVWLAVKRGQVIQPIWVRRRAVSETELDRISLSEDHPSG